LPLHRDVVARRGTEVVPMPVDERGARTDLLATPEFAAVRVAVATPAHQFPIGVTMRPDRRHAVTAWASSHDGYVVEDDYDGEYRYDRQPIGALQGTSPERVIYVGTSAKTLGPGVRLAWMVVPPALIDGITDAKMHADVQTEAIGQLALADLITSHGYDRHIRSCRLRYRRRRDALVERVRSLPLHGIAAGLQALVTLPESGPTEREVLRRADRLGLAVGHLSMFRLSARPSTEGIVVGYGTPPEHAYAAALDALARALTPDATSI
ncbi:MAG TPA: PLP-dependent aminotransferase family protein, partial [Micromonosporaceae bacterium]